MGVALIDTGATISVTDRTWLLRHNLSRNIRAPKLTKVSGLGSVKINVTGFFSGNVQLGSGISCRTNFHVIDCSEVPIILGLDFLKCSGLIVDVAGRRMIKNSGGGSTIVFPMHAEMISKSSPVYSLNAISLAPGERKLIPLVVKDEEFTEGCLLPLDGCCNKSWQLAGSINRKYSENFTYGDIVNLSNKTIYVKKHDKIGTWQQVCNVVKFTDDVDVPTTEELIELLKINELSLSPSHKGIFCSLISEYRDVFCTESGKLGYCDTITHKIDVGDSAPIKQRYRRIHLPLKEEVEKELNKMVEQGLIAKSNSAWSSPLVPIKK